MTQTRGTFPELNSNYKKPAKKVAPLPLHKYVKPAAPKKGK